MVHSLLYLLHTHTHTPTNPPLLVCWSNLPTTPPPSSLTPIVYLFSPPATSLSALLSFFSSSRLSVLHCDWLDYSESRFYHVSRSLGEREGCNKPSVRRLVATTAAVLSRLLRPWLPLSLAKTHLKIAADSKLTNSCVFPGFRAVPAQLFVILPVEQSEGCSLRRRSPPCDV